MLSPDRPQAGLMTVHHWPGFCLHAHSAAPDRIEKTEIKVVTELMGSELQMETTTGDGSSVKSKKH